MPVERSDQEKMIRKPRRRILPPMIGSPIVKPVNEIRPGSSLT
jgi:hypothetical protein